MRKVLFLLILSLICFCAHLEIRNNNAAQDELVKRVKTAIEGLKKMNFTMLVPDSLIAQNIAELTNSPDWCPINPNAPRHDIYVAQICPAFDNKEQCWDALEASVAIDPHAGFTYNQLSFDLYEPVDEAKKWILKVGKDYLKDPKNLLSFYQAKKDLILAEATKGKGPSCFAKNMTETRKGLEAFNNPEFRALRKEFLAAENEWLEQSEKKDKIDKMRRIRRDDLIKGLSENDEFRREVYSKGYEASPIQTFSTPVPEDRQALAEDFIRSQNAYAKAYEESYATYRKMRDIEDKMKKMTPDLQASMFAGRRFDDGGQELVDAWIKVATDLETCLYGLLPKRVPDLETF